MEALIRIVAYILIRLGINYQSQHSHNSKIAAAINNLNLRVTQLESGAISAEDAYIIAASIQNRLAAYDARKNKRLQASIAMLSQRLENVKQSSFSRLDTNTQTQAAIKSERFSYLPDLLLATQAYDANKPEMLARASNKKLMRWLGALLFILAIIVFLVLFTIFDPDAPAETTDNIVIAILCLPPSMIILSSFFILRGNIGKADLSKEAQYRLKTNQDLVERIYGLDNSRYADIYEENRLALDALLQRLLYQDLSVLYQD